MGEKRAGEGEDEGLKQDKQEYMQLHRESMLPRLCPKSNGP